MLLSINDSQLINSILRLSLVQTVVERFEGVSLVVQLNALKFSQVDSYFGTFHGS